MTVIITVDLKKYFLRYLQMSWEKFEKKINKNKLQAKL
jgi:hypothetical protein